MVFIPKTGLAGIVTGALVLGLATAALAQGEPKRPSIDDVRLAQARDGGKRSGGHSARQLEILDTDGNGTASREEISGELSRLLGAADVDGNGQLSPDEFRRRGSFFIRLGTTTFFDLIDANGDQQISEEELIQPMERWFTRRDVNSDGNIDTGEFNQGRRSSGRRHR